MVAGDIHSEGDEQGGRIYKLRKVGAKIRTRNTANSMGRGQSLGACVKLENREKSRMEEKARDLALPGFCVEGSRNLESVPMRDW
jgi:hypothetical protein